MRLIDADQFGVITLQGKSEEFIDGAGFMFDKIHEAPTIEARQHGEWIDTGYGTSRCSVCGEKCQTYCMDKPRDRYCLWCGADMRKAVNRNE